MHAGRRGLIVVPAYNEERSISRVLDGLAPYRSDFDVLVVNDGSLDDTEELVKSARVLQAVLPCNLGYSRAVQTGLRFGVRKRYPLVVLFDADGQHDPANLSALVAPLMAGEADLTLGSRYLSGPGNRTGLPLARRIGQWVFALLASVMTGRTISDTTSGFKAMTCNVAEEVLRGQFVDMHSELLVYLIRLGFRVKEVPIEVRGREHGESMYSLLSHVVYPFQTALIVLLGWVAASVRKAGRK